VVRVAAPKSPSPSRATRSRPTRSPGPWCARATRRTTEPAATFVHLHPARLASAAVPIAARDAAYRLDRAASPRGFALRHGGRVAGHLPWHHQELVVALNHLDALARSPRALAAILEAAGATALRRVDALLAGRSA
jgi:hypothetical protein